MAKKRNRLGVSWGDNPESRRVIREAAFACFSKYGVQRTFMADIAEAANVSRKTLYRVFEDRTALIEHLIAYRLTKLGTDIRTKIRGYRSFEKAIIDGSVASVTLAQNDPSFAELVLTSTNHRIEQFMLRGNPQIVQYLQGTWFPVIEQGREEGIVRAELSNERIVELFMSVQVVLWLRDDYSAAKKRALVRDLLWSAITYTHP